MIPNVKETAHTTPTGELIKDHESILEMLEVLERICAMLDSGIRIDVGDLESILEFLTSFADCCHHAKEEQGLFPALEEAGIPREHGPIGVMLAEHDLGRKYIKGMQEALKEPTAGHASGQRMVPFSSNGRAYAALLRAHIEKENTILFPMADVAIPKERQEELLREFRWVKGEKIGEERHNALLSLLDDLKGAYLYGNNMIAQK